MSKENKNYFWFSVGIICFGLMIFLVSLVAAMTNSKLDLHAKERTIYFDRKILPDHVFYPILMAVDRLELELSSPDERIILEMDYAAKRLEAAKALLAQGKEELALSTLGKAHRYLLSANEDVVNLEKEGKIVNFAVGLNKTFLQEYAQLTTKVSDLDRAQIETMIGEVEAVGSKL